MNTHSGPLYLRDLNADARLSFETYIRNNHDSQRLIEAMESGLDIEIGSYYKIESISLA